MIFIIASFVAIGAVFALLIIGVSYWVLASVLPPRHLPGDHRD